MKESCPTQHLLGPVDDVARFQIQGVGAAAASSRLQKPSPSSQWALIWRNAEMTLLLLLQDTLYALKLQMPGPSRANPSPRRGHRPGD